jgi:hypothetical protein
MKDINRTILNIDVPRFWLRFLKSLATPWAIVFLLLFIPGRFVPFFWIVPTLFILIFLFMNYKAMKQFISRIELDDAGVKLTFFEFDEQANVIKIPRSELIVKYYSNGTRGISTFVSDHLRIQQERKVLIKQYVSKGWPHEVLDSVHNELKNFSKK